MKYIILGFLLATKLCAASVKESHNDMPRSMMEAPSLNNMDPTVNRLTLKLAMAYDDSSLEEQKLLCTLVDLPSDSLLEFIKRNQPSVNIEKLLIMIFHKHGKTYDEIFGLNQRSQELKALKDQLLSLNAQLKDWERRDDELRKKYHITRSTLTQEPNTSDIALLNLEEFRQEKRPQVENIIRKISLLTKQYTKELEYFCINKSKLLLLFPSPL